MPDFSTVFLDFLNFRDFKFSILKHLEARSSKKIQKQMWNICKIHKNYKLDISLESTAGMVGVSIVVFGVGDLTPPN